MPLSTAERERAGYHLGYLQVSGAASIQLGIPKSLPTVFLLETALNNVIEAAVPRVRQHLKILDGVETKLVGAQDRLAAKQLDGLTLRENEPDMLEREYRRWSGRLADLLGVPLYPYSDRNRRTVVAGNIPVR